jgi:hypothetical protein
MSETAERQSERNNLDSEYDRLEAALQRVRLSSPKWINDLNVLAMLRGP